MRTGATNSSNDFQGYSTDGAVAAVASTNEHRLPHTGHHQSTTSLSRRKSSTMNQPNYVIPNTYRMEPENDYRFRPYKLQAKILEVLIEHLKDKTYDPATVSNLITKVTSAVHQLVRNFPLPRYKIVVQTAIIQKYQQNLQFGSRCLWNTKTDNMFSINYETKDMITVVTIYAVYYE